MDDIELSIPSSYSTISTIKYRIRKKVNIGTRTRTFCSGDQLARKAAVTGKLYLSVCFTIPFCFTNTYTTRTSWLLRTGVTMAKDFINYSDHVNSYLKIHHYRAHYIILLRFSFWDLHHFKGIEDAFSPTEHCKVKGHLNTRTAIVYADSNYLWMSSQVPLTEESTVT